MKRRFLCVVLIIALVTIGSRFGRSQTTTATLSGTVADETGGVLPSAQVTITNVANGAKRTALTNERGRFIVPQLPPGPYEPWGGKELFQLQRLTYDQILQDVICEHFLEIGKSWPGEAN